jgi:hypothetical protein
MKRLLLSVFAAAITAAMVLPVAATASDITFSGSYKLRGESVQHSDFTKTASEKNIWHQRTRLTANAAATDDASVKVTIQDTRDWGEGTIFKGGNSLTESGANHLDVYEASLTVNNLLGTGADLTVGRQEINLGDQRLIGAFGWNEKGHSFDALRVDYAVGDTADILLVSTKLVEGTSNADDDVDMYIAQATIKTIPNNTLDIYGIFLRNSSTTQVWNSAMESGALTLSEVETLNTYGVRLKGNVDGAGVDYTVEVSKQTGEAKSTAVTQDKDALAYAVRVNYALPNNANKIKLGFEYASASGDKLSGDNKVETFSNIFPTNHAHFGIADRHAWRNLNAWGLKASAKVNDQLSVKAAYWDFSLDEKADGAYAAGNWNGNTASTLGITNTKDAVGSEFDVVANYKLNSATGLQVGWSRYFVGDAITANNATAEDSDFAYLQLLAKF